jgi:DNA-binding transcriptional ArsR family regulator
MALSQVFSALSEKNRQKILDLLKEGEMTVTDILGHLEITMPTLSHHLDILKQSDLISSRRDGQQIFYSLNMSVMDEVAEKIAKFLSNKK